MSREKRKLRKKFIVFCEGDTEYNYIDTMRLNQGVELALKPINMHGGGYSNFLEVIKKEANNNCLAKFIVIDYDRVKKHPGELAKLKEIIEYCKLQNSNKRIRFTERMSVRSFRILQRTNFRDMMEKISQKSVPSLGTAFIVSLCRKFFWESLLHRPNC